MSTDRIKAILLSEFFITKRSLEVIMDLFFFSLMATIVFGFVSVFLASSIDSTAAHYLFLGIILMEVIRVTQYSISVSALWEVWSRNLSNVFITPLSLKEYLFALFLSGAAKSLLTFTAISLISTLIFKFNIFSAGFHNLALYFVNLTIFSWSIGLFILGFIFRFGTRIQALAWGLIFLVQPLTAAFFPVNILPSPLQVIAYSLPPTYIFEAARGNLENPSVNWNLIGMAAALNIFYFALALWFFNIMFKKSKQTGQFAKLEG